MHDVAKHDDSKGQYFWVWGALLVLTAVEVVLGYKQVFSAVRMLEVFERHATFADADGFVEGRAARFMAHVRAIRQIVRAELPREKLVTKGCFIAGAAAGVKGGGIRRRQRIQLTCHELESFLPSDRFVMGGV